MLEFWVGLWCLVAAFCEGKEINGMLGRWCQGEGFTPRKSSCWLCPKENLLSLLAASYWALGWNSGLETKAWETNGLKKKCLRIAQAAFFPPLLLGCHRALCWCGCQAYVKAPNRYLSTQAGRELGIWLQQRQHIPGIGSCCGRQCCLGCLQPSRAALTSWGGEGCLAHCWRGL